MRKEVLLLSLISMAMPLAPAAGDWIRTREGALVETKGPWKVKGAVVLFTSPEGRLSSLRVSEVDLDGSAVATAEAKKAPPPPPPEAKREPVLDLTNKDISRAGGRRARPEGRPGTAAEAGTEAEAGTTTEEEEAPGSRQPPPAGPAEMRVVSWRQIENAQISGVEIVGTLQNVGSAIATDLGVTVTLFNDDGTEIASVNAFLGTVSLAPRHTTTLRALFPDVYTFADEPDFAIRNNSIEVQGVTRPRSDL